MTENGGKMKLVHRGRKKLGEIKKKLKGTSSKKKEAEEENLKGATFNQGAGIEAENTSRAPKETIKSQQQILEEKRIREEEERLHEEERIRRMTEENRKLRKETKKREKKVKKAKADERNKRRIEQMNAPRCYCPHSRKRLPSYYKKGSICSNCGSCETCLGYTLESPELLCSICQSNLLRLPAELFQEVLSHLDTNSKMLLRLTCKNLYNTIPLPTTQRTKDEIDAFFLLIREMFPKWMEYCPECTKYHRWTSTDYYYWDENQRCKRKLLREWSLGPYRYICNYCNSVRPYQHCQLCYMCETCAKVFFRSPQSFSTGKTHCRTCEVKKIPCRRCNKSVLARRACRSCKICESCANCRFQFGTTECSACGGNGLSAEASTRRVMVETGPGYEMWYFGGERRDWAGGWREPQHTGRTNH